MQPTPAKERRFAAFGEFESHAQRLVKVVARHLFGNAPAQGLGPQEFAVRGHVLRVAAAEPQLAGEAAIGIVFEVRNAFRNCRARLPLPFAIERMNPAAGVEKAPERIFVQLPQVGDE